MPLVYSSLPADTLMVRYRPKVRANSDKEDIRPDVTDERRILIKGGAGIINPKSGQLKPTVATFISDDDLDFIKCLGSFQRLVDKGFITIETEDKTVREEERSKSMNLKSGSAPLTPKKLSAKKVGAGNTNTYEIPSVDEIAARNQS